MAGYREFQTGEVLTAANVNSFLMEQATMTFADAAARDAALAGVLREGLLTYNLDTNRLEVYDGTAWVEPAPEPPAGIGSNVVQAVKTDEFTTSSSTYVDVTGLSVTITPSSDTSKVLLLAHVNGSSTAAGAFAFRFTGGNSTAYVGDSEGARTRAFSGIRSNSTNFTVARVTFPVTAVYLDSPVSAAPVTYKVQMLAAAGTVHVNRVDENVNEAAIMRTASSLTVVEVAG